MLNEIIKTAEELNTAALYYRQSGNMDGVRELAKAHAVSKKQTEEFIQGSRYRLVDGKEWSFFYTCDYTLH